MEPGGQCFLLTQAFPKDPIDKALQIFRQVGGLHSLDRLIDCGRFRNPVEEKDLVQPGQQGLVDKGFDPGERLLAKRLQQGFKGLSLPQNAVDDVHGQMAFAADERALGGYFVKE